jgi:hypothetical protein
MKMLTVLLALVLSALSVAEGAAAPAQEQDVQKLIQALSNPSKDERDRAVNDLAKVGRPALEALRKAATSADLEIKGLANQAIEKIEWGGLDPLKLYMKENFEDGSVLEQAKLKGVAKWFPDTRFYEVAPAAPAGNQQQMMINMGMGTPKSLFALRKFEPGFYRISVKGITAEASIETLLKKSKITIPDADAALDLAVAYMEIQTSTANANQMNWMMNGGSRLEKTADGYSLHSGMYGSQVTFKVDAAGLLVDVLMKGASVNQWGHAGDKSAAEERQKLEAEKLRLEVELLKKQLEKK